MTQISSQPLTRDRHELLRPVYVATALILIAETVYVIVWGVIMFPAGSLAGKLVWAFTCGVAMGAVIGVATIILTNDHMDRWTRMAVAAAAMAVVGSSCTLLCSRIDARFLYFGGPENSDLFIVGGIVPSVLGGLLYGSLVSRPQPGAKQ